MAALRARRCGPATRAATRAIPITRTEFSSRAAVENAGEIGIAATRRNWEASARVRYLGEYPLTPDNAERASAENSLNLRGAYTIGEAQIYGELLNVLDEHGKDIVYWYEAYVDGLDPPGLTSEDIDCDAVSCRISRAEEPRTLRLGVKFRF